MKSRTQSALLAIALLTGASATVQASIIADGDPVDVGSWKQRFVGIPDVAFDTIVVWAGGDGDYPAAIFEAPALRGFGASGWVADPGSSVFDMAHGSPVEGTKAIVFEIWFSTDRNQSLEFDIFAFDSRNPSGFADLSQHLEWIVPQGAASGYWNYESPAKHYISFQALPIPEPATLVVWSGILLSCLSARLCTWRRKRVVL